MRTVGSPAKPTANQADLVSAAADAIGGEATATDAVSGHATTADAIG